MAKFNFNLRNPGKSNRCLIYLIVRFDNLKVVVSTGEVIDPKFWETDKSKKGFQRVRNTRLNNEAPEINSRLDNIEMIAKNAFRKFANDNNRNPSKQEYEKELKKALGKGSENRVIDFFDFIDKFIEEADSRTYTTGRKISKGTILAYKNTLRILKEYQSSKRRIINFDTIDLDFYYDFVEYLKDKEGFSQNTVGKHIKTIKAFLNDATERGYNKNLAFKSKRFKILSEKTESIFLTEDELKDIYSLDLTANTRLEKVRDLFIIGCYTGLRFSDFSALNTNNFEGDDIVIQTKKTGVPVRIPIHPFVREIINKYSEYPNSLPPSISNPKMNLYLKEIGEKVECLKELVEVSKTTGGLKASIKKHKYELLTTHTARRSFATNLFLQDIPPIRIMAITGHRTEKAFLGYIKITPKENADAIRLHWNKTAL